MSARWVFPVRLPQRIASGVFILLCLAALLAGCDELMRKNKKGATAHDKCLQLAIRSDAHGKPYLPDFAKFNGGWEFYQPEDSDTYYGGDCNRKQLRGCLLPPEEYSAVEEFKYRLRHCQTFGSCTEYAQQASSLQAEKLELRKRKNEICRAVTEQRAKASDCVYSMRRLTVVIDTLTTLETAFEEKCGYQ